MNRANLWKASLVMVVALAAACGQELPSEEQASSLATREDEVFSSNKALILASTVSGGLNSPEAAAVRKLNYAVEVVTDAQWSAMTASQFATYRVLVLGDKGCANLNAVSAAVANRAVWGPVVNGNVLIAGTAPTANGAHLVTERAIRFAAFSPGKTGLYASLSCYYQNAEPGTYVTLLEPFGDFEVQGGSCHNSAHIVANHPALDMLTDEAMSNWPCSVNSSFTSFPMANFAPWSVAMYPAPEEGEMGTMGIGVQAYVDGSFGAPYILARGATLMGCGDGWAMPMEECDFGIEVNGMPGVACSATCRLNWCGDGKVSAGEDCDPKAPGMASCPSACRLMTAPPPPPPPPANLPPVAVCKNLVLNTPANACGASGLVNNGSYDPEGGAVSCTQSVSSFNLGQQSVTLTCTDAQGLAASCNAHVTVVDAHAPQISCPAASTFECGVGTASLEQNPATATDNCGTPYVYYELEGETFSLGSARSVRWNANDGTNEASCYSQLTMVDTLAPAISLNGPARQRLECKVDSYTEQRASASDACAGDLSDRVAISGTVNTAAVGLYPVSYRIMDPSGHQAQTSREVEVADTRAPVVTLNGASAVALECGVSQYAEAGAVASDVCAGNLAVAISGTVNPAAKGNYSVSYRASDASGNVATAQRSVSVKDTLAPSIALKGSASLKLECKVDSYTEQNAVASDACSGDLSGSVAISGTVNPAAVGSYPVRYSVQDAMGLSASVTRTVQVADTKAPVLSLNGSNMVALECGVDSYTELRAVASDVCTGDLSGSVAISGTVDAKVRGAYPVRYQVADASGNAASAVRSVSVNDTLAPSIALNGLAAMKLECGVDSYTELRAVASDACSGNLTGAIVTTGSVGAAVGNYSVSYKVTDGAGLSASVSRSVQVADTKAPVLSLNGASALSLECGVDSYTEQDAVASDLCGGDLTSSIVKSGTVNMKAPGSYEVRYQVADASGNAASAQRSVSVNDTLAPSITLLGAASMKVAVGSTFMDPGATAADACSGNLRVIKSGTVNTAVAGSYTLTYSAQDAAGFTASVTRTVTVEQAPQSCTSVSVKSPREIWPPNHKMWNFNLSECAVVQNPCGGPVDINAVGTITSIYSDEVEDANGKGDGSTLQDIVITGQSTFQLRAERQGKGNGRVYGVNFKVTDSSGAEQTATCKFVVPHDQSGRGATDDGAAAGYTVFAPAQLAGR